MIINVPIAGVGMEPNRAGFVVATVIRETTAFRVAWLKVSRMYIEVEVGAVVSELSAREFITQIVRTAMAEWKEAGGVG